MKKKTKSSTRGNLLIAGLDEVGRGPWAGPIIACAYIEIENVTEVKIDDSKKLNEAQREKAYEKLIKFGHYGIGITSPAEIDKMGLSKANQTAFRRAIEALPVKPDLIMIDGRDKINPAMLFNIPFKTIIKGDSLVKSISCASIIAKVTRDRLMVKMARKYPNYGFEAHKGYGTAEHRKSLNIHGACLIHRRSFKPVNLLLQKNIFE